MLILLLSTGANRYELKVFHCCFKKREKTPVTLLSSRVRRGSAEGIVTVSPASESGLVQSGFIVFANVYTANTSIIIKSATHCHIGANSI